MLKRFFIICSGADTDILQQCSKGEQNKYAGIGATVFFTAIMAFIAAGYALYTVFDNLFTAVFFGLIWGLLIFNLDRYIVSTIKKTNNTIDEFIQATPRIILAIIIAIVIAKPLELKIFEKEINQVLLEEKNAMTLANQNQIAAQYTPEIDALSSEITNLKDEITAKEIEVNNLYDVYISEAEGTAGTKLLGKGPVYKEKREKHDAALLDLQTLKEKNKTKILEAETKITELKGSYNTKVINTQPIISNFDGLMARINALDKLPWLPSFFIFLLFLAIETAPIFAKLLAPKGIYDFNLEDQEDTVKNIILQHKNQRTAMVSTENAIDDRVYTNIKTDEELYKYKHKKAHDFIQLKADAFYKKQKSAL
ncbi:DUF4407 domain-containing protein [Hyunsoonleella ulvae]|uniref:DUF4407 domain-containing protein n=1 Tax=Hyunsoonleella ulvae TaxID=2799948 RepID=UPI001939DAEC|nr:DUF4407 domain-containing protein [Hyunsoonleella ulvae]